MTFATKTFRNIIIASLFAGAGAACIQADDYDEDYDATEDALVAQLPVECRPKQVDAEPIGEGVGYADSADADAAELMPVCKNCGCDLHDATSDCRDLAGCGNGAVAQAVSGNTCSNSKCRNNSGCGGKIKCMEGGQECGTLADDSGVCKFQ